MNKNIVGKSEAKEIERLLNQIWRCMVEGFQKTDPTLATTWGAREPAPYVGPKTGNRGLCMHCDNLKASVLVEVNMETGLYLLTAAYDDGMKIPITTVMEPSAIAPCIIEWAAVELKGLQGEQ